MKAPRREAFQAAIQSAQAAGYSDWLASDEVALDYIATAHRAKIRRLGGSDCQTIASGKTLAAELTRNHMLPEFPIAQEAVQKAWNEVFFEALGVSNPLIAQLEIRVQKEGTRAFIGSKEIAFKKAHVEDQWKPEVGKGIPSDEFFARAERVGDEMAKQQAALCYEVLSTPGPHNAVFKGADTPFCFEDYLSSLEKMEIDFDEAGMPKWPKAFVGFEAFASVQTNRKAWSLTEERQRRLTEFVERKRKEFNERKARRRLVD